MPSLTNLLQGILQESFFNLSLYLIFGISIFFLVWIVLKNKWRWRRIQPKAEKRNHYFKHDILYSVGSTILAGFLTVLIKYFDSMGYMKLYWNFNLHGTFWGVLQFFVLLLFYDTYFYWTHRLMHHPKIFRYVHKTHHKSTDPSPLTIFAFHPLENLIEFIPFFILPMIIPIYWPVLFLWQILDLINNLLAHLGYEIYPKAWIKIPLIKFKTASTHHNMHHEKFNGNYGLYFTWWDKLMGTEFKNYKDSFNEIHNRK